MSYSMPDGPVVTIPNGGSDSPAMIADETISDALEIAVKAPAALTGACTIQVSFDFNKGYRHGPNPQTLAQATAAATWVATPAASALTVAVVTTHLVSNLICAAWRIHSAGVEAADRAFQIIRRTVDTSH